MPNLDALSLHILQASSHRLGQFDMAGELVSLDFFVKHLRLIGDGALVRGDHPRISGAIGEQGLLIWPEAEFLDFDELGSHLANLKTFEQRDQTKVHLDGGAVNNCFTGYADRVFQLVRPHIGHALQNGWEGQQNRMSDRSSTHHSMCERKGIGVQSSDDPQRFPDHHVLAMFSAHGSLEPVGHKRVGETLDTFRQRPLQHLSEGKFVVVGLERLMVSRQQEIPRFFKELVLSIRFGRRAGQGASTHRKKRKSEISWWGVLIQGARLRSQKGNVRNSTSARQSQGEMFDGHWLAEACHQLASQMGAGRILGMATEENEVIIEPDIC